MVRHKVYAADYVADVASDSAALQTSPVVEGTAAGPVLIGASRERVGFDREFSLPVVRALAAGATRLFPFLSDVHAMRSYLGFRPYMPDHLPPSAPTPVSPASSTPAATRALKHRTRHRHRAPDRPTARRQDAGPRPGTLPARPLPEEEPA